MRNPPRQWRRSDRRFHSDYFFEGHRGSLVTRLSQLALFSTNISSPTTSTARLVDDFDIQRQTFAGPSLDGRLSFVRVMDTTYPPTAITPVSNHEFMRTTIRLRITRFTLVMIGWTTHIWSALFRSSYIESEIGSSSVTLVLTTRFSTKHAPTIAMNCALLHLWLGCRGLPNCVYS